MNPNYLEYDPSVTKLYYKKYQTIVPVDFEYIKEINKGIFSAFRKNKLEKSIHQRCYKFVQRYNHVVDLIEQGYANKVIGQYKKIAIQKRFGNKRIVYEPSAQFKFILSKLADILEYVLYDTFAPRNRYKKIDISSGKDVRCDVSVDKTKRHNRNVLQYVPMRSITASNRSVNNVLYSMGHHIAKHLSYIEVEQAIGKSLDSAIRIYKFDIKDAFTSTKLHLVKTLIDHKLAPGKLKDFILKHIDMCFVNDSLPPGYPTSSALFGFVKDIMMHRFYFKDQKVHGCEFFSYVDDFYFVTTSPNGYKTVEGFHKYIRRWGYRINRKKSTIETIKKNKISSTGYSVPTKILGKVATILPDSGYYKYRVTWHGSRQVKNKIRMLNYLAKKARENNFKTGVEDKESEYILNQRKKGLEEFYFPQVGSCTYRAQ